MMKFKPCVKLVIVVAACVTSLAAQQEPKLKGKVLPEGYLYYTPWFWGGIKVKVKDRATRRFIPGEQEITQNQDWFHVAPLGALVDVLFDKGPCYVPDRLRKIQVSQENPDQPTVRLQKTRECRIVERRTRGRRGRLTLGTYSGTGKSTTATATSSGSAAAGSAARPERNQGGAASVVEPDEATSKAGVTPPGDVKVSGQTPDAPAAPGDPSGVKQGDAALTPSPEVLMQELEREAELAREGEFFDTFQVNFAAKVEIYDKVPALKKILSQFRAEEKNRDLFEQIGGISPEMYTDVVRAQLALQGEVNSGNVIKVIKNESLSPGVRGSAAVALVNLEPQLDAATRTEMSAYFYSQKPSSEIFSAARVAALRLRASDDLAKYLNDIRNSNDQEYLATSFEALAVTQLIEGKGALPGVEEALIDVAKNDEDAEHRAAAIYSLRSFADQDSETAIKAILNGLEDDEPMVRFNAVRALGYDDLEKNRSIRDALRAVVSKQNESPEVREAATMVLSGVK